MCGVDLHAAAIKAVNRFPAGLLNGKHLLQELAHISLSVCVSMHLWVYSSTLPTFTLSQ